MHRQAPGTSSDYKETSPDENEENRSDSSDSEDVGESGDESGLSENREATGGGVEIESYEEEQKKEQEAMDELEDEYREVKSNISPPQLLNLLSKAMDKLVTLTYADISNSVSNGTPFLVDGDMLLVHAMADENWSSHFGGQMLHLIYLCERRMQIFVQKGGTFQIVFFKSWYDAWDGRHDLLLARTVLLLHFKHNSPHEVYEFDHVWDPLFKHHLAKFRPAFILVDLHIGHYPGNPLVKFTYYTERLPLKYRGSVPPQEPRPDLEEFISKVQGYMTLALQQVNSEECDMSQVADIWHGNLFAYILYLLSSRDTAEQSDIWRDDTRLSYERLVTQVGDLSGRQLKPFPVHREAMQLFLTVKHLLQSCIETALSESDKKHIASWLRDLGFEEMVERCKLPLPPKNTLNPGFYVGPSHVRFQMAHLGPELDRNTGGVPDLRVTGFTPDTWQRDLFDIVDKKQSALVVAPTSSGKTYASYYCMEQVLRESNDGIVVYVSPTKALVNQVHATLYARFKNKSMPAGMSAVGVFSREYRHKALECQILVTVPQCLELLLLSPRQHSWVSRLRYVILDEIHCLAGQSGGISWERCLLMIPCPFIALSATVGSPASFHAWLQDVQNFRQEQDLLNGSSRSTGSYHVELVEYYNRHSDLTKYVYSGGKLKHIHPYAFVDDTVIKQNNGIPSHVSLSPSETLELYDIMRSVSEDDQTLDALNPDTFFNSSIFLIRDSVKEKDTKTVRKYEAKLRTLLEIWSQEQPQKFSKVHRQLNCGVNVPSENDSREALFSQCVGLIKTLHQQDMLPALIFSYDRSFVEKMFIKITEFCEEGDVKVEKEKLTKFEKHMEKKKLEELENIPKDFHRNSLGLLDGQSGFRSIGVVDKDDIKLIELRLISENYTSTSPLVRGFRQGLGLHHGGKSAKVKSSVEMMFRLRILNVVIATGTLALGIHMPCRTVVLAGDSPYINALEFHQMSGRAGRRGFDKEGHVVFMGLGRRKVQTLLTDKFPVMVGNFPLSVGTVLRLLLLVSRITSHGELNEATTRDALSRALTLLNCSMAYKTSPFLKIQMKHFFSFATQLLLLQGLVDNTGSPQKLSDIITHLNYHEPGNLAFVFLFRSGALRQLCGSNEKGNISRETELNLVLVLSYLFAVLPLHNSLNDKKFKNSRVKLPPLPAYVTKVLQAYNAQVKLVFDNYFRSMSQQCIITLGEDNKLPLSNVRFGGHDCLEEPQEKTNENKLYNRKERYHDVSCPTWEGEVSSCWLSHLGRRGIMMLVVPPGKERYHDVGCTHLGRRGKTLESLIMNNCEPRTICSLFAALSGHTDTDLYTETSIISNIRHQVFTDIKVVPLVNVDIPLNGYVWDFYNHGIASAIRMDNQLKSGYDFEKLRDFALLLKTITLSIEELEPTNPDDPVLKTFQKVSSTFYSLFNKAYRQH
uniref:ATP-dependent RNA helicase DDX60 n=1 Tax=Timema bartmani TaxID=61472 RepID=A0A7R9EYM4_9NEOP|nr:unnamed protein product [Timema bartmani]